MILLLLAIHCVESRHNTALGSTDEELGEHRRGALVAKAKRVSIILEAPRYKPTSK